MQANENAELKALRLINIKVLWKKGEGLTKTLL
jgi:hypothetical protein